MLSGLSADTSVDTPNLFTYAEGYEVRVSRCILLKENYCLNSDKTQAFVHTGSHLYYKM